MNDEERMTYAVKTLNDLVNNRELRSWCKERNLPHSTLYKIAVGEIVPTFSFICTMLPYFSPAEWIYFTDETIPYKHNPLPEWNPKDNSAFISKHKYDYMDIAKKYGIAVETARNIFINRRANFSFLQMRRLAEDINPEEFFTAGIPSETQKFFPDKGDVILLNGKNILVLSQKDINLKNDCFIGIIVDKNLKNEIKIKGKTIEGSVSIRKFGSFTYERKIPVVVDKIDGHKVTAIINKIKQILE